MKLYFLFIFLFLFSFLSISSISALNVVYDNPNMGVGLNIEEDKTVFNNTTVNTNRSDWWDDLNYPNATQMEGSVGQLNIKQSWLSTLGSTIWCTLTGCTIEGNISAENFIGDGSELTNINASSSNSTTWWAGLTGWVEGWFVNIGDELSFNETKLNETLDDKLTTTYYNATEAWVYDNRGTIDGGTLTDTQHPDANFDSVSFNFSEVSGSPALDLRVNFTDGLTSFNAGVIRYKTSDLSGDFPIIQLWSYTDSEWHSFPQLVENDEGFILIERNVFDWVNHIKDGVVQMRLYKASNGNTNNHYYIDWLAIMKGVGTPIPDEADPFFEIWLNNPVLTENLTAKNITADTYFGNISQTTGGYSEPETPTPYGLDNTGLIGYWSANGNAFDYSGNGNTGTLHNDVSYLGSAFSTGFKFDGDEDYVTIDDLDFTDKMSGSFWFRIADNTYQQYLLAELTVECQVLIITSPATLRVRIDTADGNVLLDTSSLPSVDEWHHYAWTYDGTTAINYLDGVQQDTNTDGGGNIDDNNLNWSFGALNTGGSGMNGSMDEIMIFNRVLSPDEITAIYNSRKADANSIIYNYALRNEANTFTENNVFENYVTLKDVIGAEQVAELGPELLTNPNLIGNLNGWSTPSTSTGWEYYDVTGDGYGTEVNFVGTESSNLTQDTSPDTGSTYQIKYTIYDSVFSTLSAGDEAHLIVHFCDNDSVRSFDYVDGAGGSPTGTYTDLVTCGGSGDLNFEIKTTQADDVYGYVDMINISVKNVTRMAGKGIKLDGWFQADVIYTTSDLAVKKNVKLIKNSSNRNSYNFTLKSNPKMGTIYGLVANELPSYLINNILGIKRINWISVISDNYFEIGMLKDENKILNNRFDEVCEKDKCVNKYSWCGCPTL